MFLNQTAMNKDRFIELLVKEVKHFYSNQCRSSLNDEEFCELDELLEEYEIYTIFDDNFKPKN